MNDTGCTHAADDPSLRLRCSCCGEVIGVYEPLIAIEPGRARESSRAAEPEIATTAPGEYRHRECHERRSALAPNGASVPAGAQVAAQQPGRAPWQAHAHARESALAV